MSYKFKSIKLKLKKKDRSKDEKMNKTIFHEISQYFLKLHLIVFIHLI